MLKNEVTQWPRLPFVAHGRRLTRHPWREEAGFIMHAIIGQKLLCRETQNLTVAQHGRRVIRVARQAHRQAHHHANPVGPRAHLLQMRQCRQRHPVAQKQIFAAVAGQAQLGQAQQLHARRFGLLDSRLNISQVVGPVDGNLVEGGSGDAHGNQLTMNND